MIDWPVWERVEPGLDIWETDDGYQRTMKLVGGDEVYFVTGPRDGLFVGPDPDQLDRCVMIHREERE